MNTSTPERYDAAIFLCVGKNTFSVKDNNSGSYAAFADIEEVPGYVTSLRAKSVTISMDIGTMNVQYVIKRFAELGIKSQRVD